MAVTLPKSRVSLWVQEMPPSLHTQGLYAYSPPGVPGPLTRHLRVVFRLNVALPKHFCLKQPDAPTPDQ